MEQPPRPQKTQTAHRRRTQKARAANQRRTKRMKGPRKNRTRRRSGNGARFNTNNRKHTKQRQPKQFTTRPQQANEKQPYCWDVVAALSGLSLTTVSDLHWLCPDSYSSHKVFAVAATFSLQHRKAQKWYSVLIMPEGHSASKLLWVRYCRGKQTAQPISSSKRRKRSSGAAKSQLRSRKKLRRKRQRRQQRRAASESTGEGRDMKPKDSGKTRPIFLDCS